MLVSQIRHLNEIASLMLRKFSYLRFLDYTRARTFMDGKKWYFIHMNSNKNISKHINLHFNSIPRNAHIDHYQKNPFKTQGQKHILSSAFDSFLFKLKGLCDKLFPLRQKHNVLLENKFLVVMSFDVSSCTKASEIISDLIFLPCHDT